MGIHMEGTSEVTCFFLESSVDVKDFTKRPPLMRALLPSTSPLVMIMQWFSHMIFETPTDTGRVMLFCVWSGFSSWAEMHERAYDSWVRLRTASRTSMAWIWRKHVRELRRFPTACVSFADPLAPAPFLSELEARWESARFCCLPDMPRSKQNVVQIKNSVFHCNW